MKFRIGIDLDGVCYHWERTARYLLRERLPNSPYTKEGPLGQVSTSWNYIPNHVSNAHWKWLWADGIKEGLFRHGHIVKGAVEGLQTLAADGHDLIVITHRPKQAVRDTLQWLSFLDMPFAGIHIMTQQERKSLAEPQCHVYVDDKPENVEDMEANTDARAVLLFDQPWNQHFVPYGGIKRVVGWKGVVKQVRGMAA